MRVRYQWCCFRPATIDGLPMIDRAPGLDNGLKVELRLDKCVDSASREHSGPTQRG